MASGWNQMPCASQKRKKKRPQQLRETTPFLPSRGEAIEEGTRELEAFGRYMQLEVGSTTWGGASSTTLAHSVPVSLTRSDAATC